MVTPPAIQPENGLGRSPLVPYLFFCSRNQIFLGHHEVSLWGAHKHTQPKQNKLKRHPTNKQKTPQTNKQVRSLTNSWTDYPTGRKKCTFPKSYAIQNLRMNLSCMNFTSHGKYDRHVTPSHTTMINACCTSLTVIRDRFGPGTAHTGLSVTVLCSPLPLCTDTEAATSHETSNAVWKKPWNMPWGHISLGLGCRKDCCSSTHNRIYSKGTEEEQFKPLL